jgi:flagellar FliL protein
MADHSADDTASGAAPAKKRRRIPKMALFIGGPIVLLAMIGGGLYFTGMLNGLLGVKSAKTADAAQAAPKEIVFLDVPDMLVNLDTGGRRENYLKLTVSLQLESKDDVAKVQALMPRVTDTCQNYLRELRLEDLKGSAGLYRLREELQLRITSAVAPVRVDDVLFKDMLVQ